MDVREDVTTTSDFFEPGMSCQVGIDASKAVHFLGQLFSFSNGVFSCLLLELRAFSIDHRSLLEVWLWKTLPCWSTRHVKLRWTKPLEIPQRWAIPISILKKAYAHPDWLTELAVSAMFHLQAWGETNPQWRAYLCVEVLVPTAAAMATMRYGMQRPRPCEGQKARWSRRELISYGWGILSASLYSYLVVIWKILHCMSSKELVANCLWFFRSNLRNMFERPRLARCQALLSLQKRPSGAAYSGWVKISGHSTCG